MLIEACFVENYKEVLLGVGENRLLGLKHIIPLPCFTHITQFVHVVVQSLF